MALIAHVVLSGITREQYDQVREAVGWLEEPPAGGLSHVTWWEGGDCHNTDAWESEEAFNNFAAERLGPGMAKVGVESQPLVTFYPAHEVYAPQAVTLTV
jgi:hypothetical protein